MSNTTNNVPKNLCTGYGACYNLCPAKAIEMKANSGV